MDMKTGEIMELPSKDLDEICVEVKPGETINKNMLPKLNEKYRKAIEDGKLMMPRLETPVHFGVDPGMGDKSVVLIPDDVAVNFDMEDFVGKEGSDNNFPPDADCWMPFNIAKLTKEEHEFIKKFPKDERPAELRWFRFKKVNKLNHLTLRQVFMKGYIMGKVDSK